ncbi:MAG: RDD family protein [Deltaproteobacteria bacterium]|nr:RDD family protein [Deltaproteobacteria bacterium]
MNFSISAYCGRCERPLPRSNNLVNKNQNTATHGKATITSPNLGALPPVHKIVGLPPSPVKEATPPPTSSVAAPIPVLTPALVINSPSKENIAAPEKIAAIPAAVKLTPSPAVKVTMPAKPHASPVVEIPAPLPPLSLEASPPTVQPIALDSKAVKKPKLQPNFSDVWPEQDQTIALKIPSFLRAGLAKAIDLSLVVAVAVITLIIQVLLWDVSFVSTGNTWLDRIAEWLNFNDEILINAIITAALFAAIYSAINALGSGQTLGRRVTDTVLVRQNGKPFSIWLAIIRSLIGFISVVLGGIGWFWSIVDPWHRSWPDKFMGSVVVCRHHSKTR